MKKLVLIACAFAGLVSSSSAFLGDDYATICNSEQHHHNGYPVPNPKYAKWVQWEPTHDWRDNVWYQFQDGIAVAARYSEVGVEVTQLLFDLLQRQSKGVQWLPVDCPVALNQPAYYTVDDKMAALAYDGTWIIAYQSWFEHEHIAWRLPPVQSGATPPVQR